MPYTSELIAVKKVIYTCYFGDVTSQDIAGGTGNSFQYLNSSEVPLSILTDVSNVLSQPHFIDIWRLAKRVVAHKQLSAWVVVGVKNQFLRVVLKMIAKYANLPYRECETLEEAFAFLAKRVDI